jgi:hypothetical protein
MQKKHSTIRTYPIPSDHDGIPIFNYVKYKLLAELNTNLSNFSLTLIFMNYQVAKPTIFIICQDPPSLVLSETSVPSELEIEIVQGYNYRN